MLRRIGYLAFALLAVAVMFAPALVKKTLAAPNDGQSHVYSCSATIPAGGGPPSGGCTEVFNESDWVTCVQSPVVFVLQPDGSQVANYTISCSNGELVSPPAPEVNQLVQTALADHSLFPVNDGQATWDIEAYGDDFHLTRFETDQFGVKKQQQWFVDQDGVIECKNAFLDENGWSGKPTC